MSAKSKLAILVLLLGCLVAIPIFSQDKKLAEVKPRPEQPAYGFPDFGYLPSPDEVARQGGKIFKLSQKYPQTMPTPDKTPPFLKTDYKGSWKKYAEEVRTYCLDGNVEVDFRVEENTKHPQRWFHAPWQHYGPTGREGLHGLTKEARVRPRQFGPTQTTDSYQAYAIGFYNELAGYTLGEVWRHPEHPDLRATDARFGGGFPIGAVIFKLLFTDASVAEVPYLENSIEWDAIVAVNFDSDKRVVRKLRLIQMDFMIREDVARAPRGWVFGTFVYNGKLARPRKWDNLVPVGIQWGDDPAVTTGEIVEHPVKTQINPALKETIINDDASVLPPMHLGWGGRLNGPVDHPASSCMSCHGTAQYPVLSASNPKFMMTNSPAVGGKEWMRWFENRKFAEPFDEMARSADFCLQLQIGVQNFWQWKNEQMKGFYHFQAPHKQGFPSTRDGS